MPYRSLVFRPRALMICVVLAASSALAAGPSWTAGMTGAPAEGAEKSSTELRLVRTSYEVDVLGPVAVGVLVQEFLNESDQGLNATYAGQAPLGLHRH